MTRQSTGDMKLNTSSTARRLAAIGLLVLSPIAAWLLLVQPVWTELSAGYATIAEKRGLLARYKAVAMQESTARRRLEAAATPDSSSGFLDGESEAIASAELQKKLQAIVTRSRATFRSARPLTSRTQEDIKMIGLRIQLAGDLKAVHRSIYEVENATPFMFITRAEIGSRRTQGSTQAHAKADARRQPGCLCCSFRTGPCEAQVKSSSPPSSAGIAVLLLIAGGLTFLNYDLLTTPIAVAPIPIDNSAAEAHSAVAGQRLKVPLARPLTDYSETLARPLFNPTRRPSAQVDRTQKDTKKPKAETRISANQIQLIGIVLHAADRRVLVRSPEAPMANWHSEGDVIAGWKLIEIRSNSVLVESQGSKRLISLYTDAFHDDTM